MPIPWKFAIKKNKQLTVVAEKSFVDAPAWGFALFQRILFEFNRLFVVNQLKVSLRPTLDLPDPNGGPGGANVQMAVTNGAFTFRADGQSVSGNLPPPPNLHGRTALIGNGNPPAEIIRAGVFLPRDPKVDPHLPGSRGIGAPVRIALALHELLHACGLQETDPGHDRTTTSDPDLFMTGGVLDPNLPDGSGDRIMLGRGKFAPPFDLSARTAGLVQDNWTLLKWP
jgi:hypothetical protein